MEPIIRSILDNDLYKFHTQRAVLSYPRAAWVPVRYRFFDRRPDGKFNYEFANRLTEQVDHMAGLRLADPEADWMDRRLPHLGDQYLEYLRNYRFDPREVLFQVQDGALDLDIISRTWDRGCLWEVPLMAIISELYFLYCDTDWSMDGQEAQIDAKGDRMQGLWFSEFGTRRRRNFQTQDLVVRGLRERAPGWFLGTSNLYLAQRYDLQPVGTVPHEWPMGISALDGLGAANYHAFKLWAEIFQGHCNIALPDTFGSEVFFRDFGCYLSHLYAGVRQDSGNPYLFADLAKVHYHRLGIDPATKIMMFSDNLTCDDCWDIHGSCRGHFKCRYSIGTHFTNDFRKASEPDRQSAPLNMVIKMTECNGVPVVKLSDDPAKATGDRDALRAAKWTFHRQPLDTPPLKMFGE